jgi:hypothetical protein
VDIRAWQMFRSLDTCVRELEQLARERGRLDIIVSNNGTELTSVVVLRRAPARRMALN